MPVGALTRSRRGRRVIPVVLLALVALAGLAVLTLSRGEFQRYPRIRLLSAVQQARAPAWSQPCWPSARWTDRAECQHVNGRVVWIQKHDPDGDGDRHLIVVERLRPRIVKISRDLGVQRLPRIGSRIDVVGWVMTGGSGHPEINTQRLMWAGTTKTTQSGAVISLIGRRGVG